MSVPIEELQKLVDRIDWQRLFDHVRGDREAYNDIELLEKIIRRRA